MAGGALTISPPVRSDAPGIRPSPPAWRRWLRLAPALVAVLGMAGTGVEWRAEAAARGGEFARAAAWRPDVAAYHRQWAETLLLRSPRQAEQQLLVARRLDPDDPLTTPDLTMAELSLGQWRQAVATVADTRDRSRQFSHWWLLANLYLAHQDVDAFFRNARLAASAAPEPALAPVISRALTASGGNFGRVRQMLPASSSAAAGDLLLAAVAAGNATAARGAAQWMASLPAPPQAAGVALRQRAANNYLVASWRRWPQQAANAWSQLAGAGLLPAPAKAAGAPYLRDGSFEPALTARIAGRAPVADSDLRAVLGWRWSNAPGTRWNAVEAGGAGHATAAEVALDGSQPEGCDLLRQWLLASGGARIEVRALLRNLTARPEQGLSLRLERLDGTVVGEAPLRLAATWQTSAAPLAVPGAGVEAFQLVLHYQRPLGELPMQTRFLITGVELQ